MPSPSAAVKDIIWLSHSAEFFYLAEIFAKRIARDK